VLAIAPTPAEGRRLSRSKIAAALRRSGRQPNLDARAVEIQTALRSEQLTAPARIGAAYGVVTRSPVALIVAANREITALEEALAEGFCERVR
jgi:hypothetical protein